MMQAQFYLISSTVILDLARIEAGQVLLQEELVTLGELLQVLDQHDQGRSLNGNL